MNKSVETAPLCKCGQPCDYYGPIGGYSKRCAACNTKAAQRQRELRALKKNGGYPTLEQTVRTLAALGCNVEVSLRPNTPLPERLPERKMPGIPANRCLLATEATSKEIFKAFQLEPASLWVITPTRVIERATFMTAWNAQKKEG